MTTLTKPTTDELLVEQRGHIALITLNRPERLNAITVKMLAALSQQLIACQRDPEIRVIVLTGAGRGFCSGLDLVDQQARMSGGDGAVCHTRRLFALRPPRRPTRGAAEDGQASPLRAQRPGRRLRHGHGAALRHPRRQRPRQDGRRLRPPRCAARERRHLDPAPPAGLGQSRRSRLPRYSRARRPWSRSKSASSTKSSRTTS